jgi:hypothetical protein
MRAILLVLGCVAAVLCAGCVKLGESSELPLAAVEPTAVPPDRTDCGEILGTAFRSDNERQWFMDNCSKWPLVKVPNDAERAAGVRPDSRQTLRVGPAAQFLPAEL